MNSFKQGFKQHLKKAWAQAGKNNSGMTLIELIVAIFILSLIVVPLFLTFATSANVTYRSREIGDATLTAENIAEYIIGSDFSSESVAAVESGLNTTFGVTGTSTGAITVGTDGAVTTTPLDDKSLLYGSVVGTETVPQDTFQITMDNIEVGTTTLDAVITLDRVEGEATAINAVTLTDSAQADCMFAQSKGDGVTTDPDVLSFKAFVSAAKLAGMTISTATYDDAEMKRLGVEANRTIEIAITKESYDASDEEVQWDIVITYSYDYAYTSGGSTFTYSTSYEVISDSFMAEVDEWPNIQVLFYPWYHGDENIFIVNEDENDANAAEFNLYLVKQQHTSASADLSTWETNYGVDTRNEIDVRLYNDLTLYEDKTANIYSNIGTGFTTSSTLDNITNSTKYYRIFKKDFFFSYSEFESVDSIVAESARNRYYNVTIALTIDGETTPTYELTTTKLQ